MERKIRAIGPRGVVFISEATARNSKFLAKYGITVEDEEYNASLSNPKTKIGTIQVQAQDIPEQPKRRAIKKSNQIK